MTDLGVLVGNRVGAQSFVGRLPGLAAVVGPEDSSRRDRAVHPVGVARIDEDGVQAQAARARRPGSGSLVGAQARHLSPGLAGVARLEDGCILDSRVSDVRLI